MNSTNSIIEPEGKKATLQGLVTLMRPRHWLKNVFVLAPLVFSGAFHDLGSIMKELLVTVLFCVASSAAYIVNDIQDIEYDRRHPRKSKTRPLASGEVLIPQALVLLALLYGVLIWGYFRLPAAVTVIFGYLMMNLAYSFSLKHQPVIDIFIVAMGFVLRVYAGAVALAVPLSSWMFVTTLCLALYLASVKRRQELALGGHDGRRVLQRYSVSLVDRYATMSATAALVFYSLFVVSARPEMVITIPFVLYGLLRYWYVVESQGGGESPTDALLSDWHLALTCVIWISTCLWLLWSAGR
jgi:decaprenyl-phosphate phosphoribosyltransferase